MDWKWTIVTFFLKFHLTYGTPYDLFQGSPYTGAEHRHRNRNWCAYVVPRNVSCAVQGGVESFEEPVAAPCPAYQPNCDQHVTYRTQFRPMYKIAFKRVTQLEWRCCPGYQGQDCKDMKPALHHQTAHRSQPYFPPNTGHTTRHAQRPERRETGHHEARHGGPDKVRHLEVEVKRLSQAVVDVQTALGGLTDNLRTDLQEDTNKMLVTLLNNLRPPDTLAPGAGGDENPVGLDGHQATRGAGAIGDRGIENIMARLDDMSHALTAKDDALEELRGLLASQEAQIKRLMDAAQTQVPPPLMDGGAGGAGGLPLPDLDILQTYIDGKLEKMKKQLDLSVEEQLGRQQSSCDGKIQSLQAMCEQGRDQTLTSVTAAMDTKDAELRKEIHALRYEMVAADGPVRNLRQTLPTKQEGDSGGDHKALWREISRVAEANIILNGRMDNELAHIAEPRLEEQFSQVLEELEARLNVSERNSETHCFYVEEMLSDALQGEAAALRALLDERLNAMEDQFTGMLVEMSNSSGPLRDALVAGRGGQTGRGEAAASNAPGVAFERPGSEAPDGAGGTPAGLDRLLRDLGRCKTELEILHTEVGANSDKVKHLEDLAERQSLGHQGAVNMMDGFQKGLTNIQNNVIGLASSVKGLGASVRAHNHELLKINFTCCPAGPGGPGAAGPGANHGVDLEHRLQTEALGDRLDTLETQMSSELGRCNDNIQTVKDSLAASDRRVTRLEGARQEPVGVSAGAPVQSGDGLERRIAGLRDSVRRTDTAVGTHAGDIRSLQSSLQSVQAQIATLAKHAVNDVTEKQPETPGSPSPVDPGHTGPRLSVRIPHIHIPIIIPNPRQPPGVALPNTHHQGGPPLRPSSPASPHQQPPPPVPKTPVLEAGEAGPPGFQRRVTVRRGLEEEAPVPLQGFAGAPGHLPMKPASSRSLIKPVPVDAKIPRSQAQVPPAQSSVLADNSFIGEPFSFSAGLTQQKRLSGDFGPIRFNRVLVNDGGHYSPQTGFFTAPMDGRYLVSGMLTAKPGDRLEAVLSVANRSVQRLRTSPPSTTGRAVAEGGGGSGCGGCGGSVTFSLILSLRKGDRVGLVRTAGQLATSEARETLSTYSGVYLYTPQSAR